MRLGCIGRTNSSAVYGISVIRYTATFAWLLSLPVPCVQHKDRHNAGFRQVYLLTKQVDVLGVYLYDMAFATHDFGKAASISIVLFVFIFALIMLIRKKVLRVEED